MTETKQAWVMTKAIRDYDMAMGLDSPSQMRQYGLSGTGLILGLRPADERRRYKVTPFLIGWAQT